MTISIIVAVSNNGVIGAQGSLPWRLSADLKRFKALTMGKPIIMGRKTHESIGRALPGRQNIVITRDREFSAEDCTVARSPESALAAAADSEEIMIVGGAAVYAAFFPSARRLYMTRIHADVKGDVFLSGFVPEEWVEVESEHHPADEKNEFPYSFAVYERKR
ncbi:MAG: type 3 dihydrofolate reductase [Verrucomicrobia bacterium]|nr:type 3 dihydrofolate reductase [Verrucomicrobiota bacterium]